MDPHNIALPAIIVFCSLQGSKKTYACITLMKQLKPRGIRHELPTCQSNNQYCNLKMCHDKDSYMDTNTFLRVMELIISNQKCLHFPHTLAVHRILKERRAPIDSKNLSTFDY